MNKVEEIKKEKDGIDVWEDILRYAKEGFSSIHEDDFVRMRWYGIYQQVPKDGYFMMRIKVPGGIVSTAQLREIAAITTQYGRGFTDVTTRQTFQWHWLTVADFPDIIERLDRVGITTLGACGDIPRNIVTAPVAGIHPDELFDPRPAIDAVHKMFTVTHRREFSNLPRKYKISISTDPEQSTYPEIHDFALVGIKNEAGELGFGLRVGGGLSTQPHFGHWIDVFFTEAQAAEVARAVTAIYRDFGYRAKRTHARIKFLMADWGAEKFKEKLIEYLGYTPKPGMPDNAPGNIYRDYVGVHKQKQEGLNWIGLTVLTGRVTDTQLSALADIAENLGGGEIRTTNMQNILIPGIPDANLEAAKAALTAAGFVWEGHTVRRGALACTGDEFCNLALVETKAKMIQMVTHLEKNVKFDRQLRMNMNGCPNGCAQHAIGDIGFQGCKARVADGSQVDAFDIHLGGTLGQNRTFTKAIHRKVPSDKLEFAVENLLNAFNTHHTEGEEFNEWIHRHNNEELDSFLGVETIVGAPDTKAIVAVP